MVERKRPEGRARADAALRREDGNRRRDRGKRTEDDCGAKTAVHAAHDTYGVALPLPQVKRPEQRRPNGAYRDRTGDLRLAKPALSQLS